MVYISIKPRWPDFPTFKYTWTFYIYLYTARSVPTGRPYSHFVQSHKQHNGFLEGRLQSFSPVPDLRPP